jgi:putative chitinase
MDEFEINNVKRKSAFLAQVSHESGGFRYVEEIASGEAYDYRADLGNTKSEAVDVARRNGTTAGKWFKGHGVIQITGYYNHRDCGIALNLDLVRYPRLLVEPINACRSAAWFWDSRKLNPLADNSEFKKITKLINGGYNGLEDRTNYYLRALKIL